MSEKNYIFDELSGKGKGIEKGENELFKELLEFEKTREKRIVLPESRIINFSPADERHYSKLKAPLKLAAESVEAGIEITNKRFHFFISDDNRYAIKYSKKKNEELCLTILSDSESNMDNAILFLPELDKYFISNMTGDFILGQYSNFDLSILKFRAILPLDKLGIIKEENAYSVLSYNNFSQTEIIKISEKSLYIGIRLPEKIKTSVAVLQTDKTRDFVRFQDDIIEIPAVLLGIRSLLYLY